MKNGLLILALATGLTCRSQQPPRTESEGRVVLYRKDSVYRFYTAVRPRRFKPQADKLYNWYAADTILITQGGAGGKLLHGTFQKFYPDNNLAEEGSYVYGQKNGTWKQWEPSGKLKRIMEWKQGARNGRFEEYDEAGRKTREGNFKDDKWEGLLIDYGPDGKATTTRYRKGQKIATEANPADSLQKKAH